MASRLLMTVSLVVLASAVAVCLPVRIDAVPQQETHPSADSLNRIKRELERTPAEKLKLDLQMPVATFRATVEQRRYMLSFDEWLRKEFELTPFQLQSQEWYSKCCGINLLNLSHWADKLDRARRRRELRKLREQIAGELAQLEANRKK
jgi:hypothetical protein